ncbi:MAG: hypothetical protein ACT4NU_00285 [Chromatiales bacterium]
MEAQIRAHGIAALVLGPLSGTPYKIYAVQADALGVNIWQFLAVSLPARPC